MILGNIAYVFIEDHPRTGVPFSLSLSLFHTHMAKTAGTGKLQAKAPPNNNNGQQDTHLQDNAALENS